MRDLPEARTLAQSAQKRGGAYDGTYMILGPLPALLEVQTEQEVAFAGRKRMRA